MDGFSVERMLSTVFGISRQQARQTGLRAHTHGSAKAVTLGCPDAEAKPCPG